MSNQTKDAARERAIEAFVKVYHPGAKEYPVIEQAAVCHGFDAGYDAALARTCKWTWNEGMMVFDTKCGRGMEPPAYDSDSYPPEPWEKFCPNCGGRVQEESNEK